MNNISPSFTGLKIKNSQYIKQNYNEVYKAIKENSYLNKLAQNDDVVITHETSVDHSNGKIFDSLDIIIKDGKRKLSNLFMKKTKDSYAIETNSYTDSKFSHEDLIKRLSLIDKEQSFENPTIYENNIY